MFHLPRSRVSWRSVFLLACVGWAPEVSSASASVRIHAGAHRRDGTVVQFTLPRARRAEDVWELQAADGTRRPLQRDGNQAWFLESNLPAGAVRDYAIRRKRRDAAGESGPLSAQWVDQDLEVRVENRPVFRYLAHGGRLPRAQVPPIYGRGGYLHPVFSPSGRVVTDDYPPNHIHHHGVWSAWTKTRFQGRSPDFWNMGEGKGRVDFSRFDGLTVGPVFARMRARQRFTDSLASPPVEVLEDTWTVTVFPLRRDDGPSIHVFDLHSEQRPLTDSPLELPEYFYGGLGYRGPWGWNGADRLEYLDANGRTNRVAANGTRVRWYSVFGSVDGQKAGIAVLGHPENYRAPQPLRVHPTEPFLCWAPSHLGDWSLRPGTSLISKYRFVVFDGEPSAPLLDRLWSDYAEPPVVEVVASRPGRSGSAARSGP